MRLPEIARLHLLGIAEAVMASRPPDVKIGGDYVHRWMVYPKNRWRNVYIHKFMHDDDDRALHDHEPDNMSVVLQNSYIEHFHAKPLCTVNGKYLTTEHIRPPGQLIFRLAGTAHRLVLADQTKPVITMFVQGIRRRTWGFWCPGGWRDWRDYTDVRNGRPGDVGKGCA